MEWLPVRRALLSVTDKSGLGDFAGFLSSAGVELVSTGGTLAFLREKGLPALAVSEVTGFPEILDGRVKTLHPRIHGGILADKDNPLHLAALAEHGIRAFDLVCVNLYDFAGAAHRNPDPRSLLEEIDIGGPCLLRAAAKNYHSLLVVPAVSRYDQVREELSRRGMRASLPLRRGLAACAFAATAAYDSLIASSFLPGSCLRDTAEGE
ncbi:MAG: IMP cyclohydrolase [Desulfovibrio sp.]|jgi:phosphoribosylaminoimidazolecarboxamide formyltransferase/IMP cyclohydrolase|nr:IMP cyclohydrolase [Desulfovibrio sp.]